MRVTGIWYAIECTRCEGFCIDHCRKEECDDRCEHDRACPKCKGYGYVPERAQDILVALGIVKKWGIRLFPQKKLCQQYIDTENFYYPGVDTTPC